MRTNRHLIQTGVGKGDNMASPDGGTPLLLDVVTLLQRGLYVSFGHSLRLWNQCENWGRGGGVLYTTLWYVSSYSVWKRLTFSTYVLARPMQDRCDVFCVVLPLMMVPKLQLVFHVAARVAVNQAEVHQSPLAHLLH